MDISRGELRRVGDEWQVQFERRIPAPQAKVWGAITGPGAMTRWFDETHMPDPLASGGEIRFVHTMAGVESRGYVTAVEAPRLLEFVWRSSFGPDARMSFEVLADGEESRLVLRQQLSDLAVAARSLAGWHVSLDKLQGVLGENASGQPGWAELFEQVYLPSVAGVGLSVPQAGAPAPKTTS